ncbi:MAG: diacylglycerol kinase family protein [Gemmatimonadota bacterium]
MHVILNPASRDGAGRRLRPLIERELRARRVDFALLETEGPGHGLELARALAAAGAPLVVAAGGDGTVHEVVNGILAAARPADGTRRSSTTALGLIPIGTGNDTVKMVPGTGTIREACATLAGGRTAPLDVGHAAWDGGNEHFVNAMGTGIDVEVVRQMRRSRLLPGGVIYVAALLRALAIYRPLSLRLEVDGRVLSSRVMNLAVCNGPSIGGSFRICPDARSDDGLLDVCLIAEMSLVRNARMVPRVLWGTHASSAGVTMLRGRDVHLSLDEAAPLLFQLDGELREAADGTAGVRVGMLAAALQVIRGPDGAARNE